MENVRTTQDKYYEFLLYLYTKKIFNLNKVVAEFHVGAPLKKALKDLGWVKVNERGQTYWAEQEPKYRWTETLKEKAFPNSNIKFRTAIEKRDVKKGIKHNGTKPKKEDTQLIGVRILDAIALLKANGYKIQKPVTTFEEV